MKCPQKEKPLQPVAKWWRSAAPGEGHNESCMQLRTQGPDCLARRGNQSLCKTLLPMPGRKVRAHMGGKSDIFTHAQPVISDVRTDADRSLTRDAQSEAAGAFRTVGIAGGGVVTNRRRTSAGDRDHSKNDGQPSAFSFGLIASISATRRTCCCSTRLSRRYRSISRRSISVSTAMSDPACSRLI